MTAVAVAGSLGILPGVALGETPGRKNVEAAAPGGMSTTSADGAATTTPTDPTAPPESVRPSETPGSDGAGPAEAEGPQDARPPGPEPRSGERLAPLPARSGLGKRVVYDVSAQQVWLVRDDGSVARTYLVSGARNEDKLPPGRYEVYAKSRRAVAYDYRETMGFMVRFAHGRRAPIGFHDIPRDLDGQLVQTRAQLGVPRSAGCIRQARPDARALWDFTGVGTRVVVVA